MWGRMYAGLIDIFGILWLKKRLIIRKLPDKKSVLITTGSQTTPAAVVGVLMLTESVFGPLWAWLFINEVPPISVLTGGIIIIFSILLQSFYSKKSH